MGFKPHTRRTFSYLATKVEKYIDPKALSVSKEIRREPTSVGSADPIARQKYLAGTGVSVTTDSATAARAIRGKVGPHTFKAGNMLQVGSVGGVCSSRPPPPSPHARHVPPMYPCSVYFDYEEDELMNKRREQFLSLTNRDGLLFMRKRGYEHVQAMVEEGKFDGMKALKPSRRMADGVKPAEG